MHVISGPVTLGLSCHPQAPSRAIQGIDAVVGSEADGMFTLSYVIKGDLSRLRIPEDGTSRRAHALWAHTCLEAFVMAGNGPGYRELNFSPSGEWAVFAFRSYREGGEVVPAPAPHIVVRRTANRLELDATICHDFLPQGSPLRLGLSAVVEDAAGGLSYWALRHPPGKPDFHHTDAFAFQLVLPRMHDVNDSPGRVRP